MLDLTNISLSSLLTVTTQDTESDQLPVFINDIQQDDDSRVDPDAFLLFFAEASMIQPKQEQSEPNFTESKALVAQTKDCQVKNSEQPQLLQKEPTISVELTSSSFEENVAVAWINSTYYQAEINTVQKQPAETVSSINTENQVKQDTDVELSKSEIQNKVEVQSSPLKNETLPFLPPETEIFEKTIQEVNKPDIETPSLNPLVISKNPLVISKLGDEKMDIGKDENINKLIKNQGMEQKNKEISLKTPVKPVIINNLNERVNNLNESMPEEFSLSAETKTGEQSNLMANGFNSLFEITQTSDNEPVIEPMRISNMAIAPDMQQTLPIIKNEIFNDKLLETPHNLNISTEVEHPEWPTQFSNQVVWLSQQGLKSALIKVHPQELGPLEITIKMTNDAASINVISHNQQIRDIIEQSLPRLQEMMTQQGLSLAEVSIDSNDTKHQHDRQHYHYNESMQEEIVTEAGEEVIETPVKKITPKGIVDYFA